MKSKNLTFFLLSMVFFLSGCGIVDYYNSKGLKNYLLKFIDPEKIKIVEIADGMFPSSRQGYFLFKISSEEFPKLKKALSLKQLKFQNDIRAVYLYHKKELDSIKFDIKNPNYDPNNFDTWMNNLPILPEVVIFYADPQLPPMEGNSRSSFKLLIYNTISGKCCVFLEYPYG